jgi:hypothetical protein
MLRVASHQCYGFIYAEKVVEWFVTVKKQKDFMAFQKETGCHPASSHSTSSIDSKKITLQQSEFFFVSNTS